ncbi:MAG: type II toxin-antitoxin system VapC family toxin [Alphaproteobacteria bacterium]|jgi:ribonuclease VapC|nr:type II toxin-antitoxin system VapC family toxin [Alphaproteobacteria bacterium]
MVIDASALVAILTGEPEQDLFERAIARAATRKISPVNWFETATVLGSRSAELKNAFNRYSALTRIEIIPIDTRQAELAVQAQQVYGKGRHPAKLNLGDCFAYALAKAMREPLLFKGGDFAHTDIVPAL